jgi:hypothetical protein
MRAGGSLAGKLSSDASSTGSLRGSREAPALGGVSVASFGSRSVFIILVSKVSEPSSTVRNDWRGRRHGRASQDAACDVRR